jgi:CRP-like cAMP-binding protein
MMLTIEKVLVLRSVSIFSSIATEHLIELARSARPVELKSGETLITEGDHGTAMFVIVNGRVKVHRGDRTLAELGASEVVGEMAALDPEPRSASVTAVEDTLVLRIGNKDLEYLLADDANISRGIIKVLCQRLRQ